jgi:hypothetical protein
MAEIKMGIRKGGQQGEEYRVAASQYFQRRGGHLVFMSAGGAISLAASTTTGRGSGLLLGWAVVPKDTTGYNYWVSSSTAKKDKVFVITGLDAVFEMPFDGHLASLTATLLGRGCDITCTPMTSALQKARIGKVASPLVIVGVDVENLTVQVKIKPSSHA